MSKEKVVENFADLVEGLEHLNGDLYRIRLELVQCAEPGLDLDSDELKFGNPRYVSREGKMVARGLHHDSTELMDEIRESIRKDGLKDPLQLRILEDNGEFIFEVVDGERRYRGLSKLVAENASCWDCSQQAFVEAKDLYEFVDVRIERMDDKTALQRSFSANDRSVGIGEAATVAFVRKLRICGLGDKEIRDITGKGEAWLRETDKLIALPERCFTALADEKINRRLALKLSTLKNEAEQEARLDQLIEAAQQRADRLQKALDKEESRAEEKAELAEAAVVEAKMLGDDEDAEQAKEEAKISADKVRKIRKKKEKIKNDGVKATIKDWDENDSPKPLTAAKIEKFWIEVLSKTINDDDDDEGSFDLDDARLVKSVCEAVLKGERDILKVLRTHKKHK